MNYNYKFFTNKNCIYFPCHDLINKSKDDFNCLFCFCPLHQYADCGGNYIILSNGAKDCSGCIIPHFDYDYIITQLKERNINEI